jgi:hypothetical protein
MLLASLTACGTANLTSDRSSTTASTSTTSTPTTIPSILPPSGTIPGVDLQSATNPSDIIATAERAVAVWSSTETPCYPSKAEALAARDQFARVASYLARARLSARSISNLAAFKSVIAVELEYRGLASKLTFVACGAQTPAVRSDKTKSTTTTSPNGTTNGLAAGGVAEVELTISGAPRVDSTFTVADLGSPCDGLSANTSFLVSARDATGRWIITDVVTHDDGARSAVITPTLAGPGAVEYLAYCGTSDKRHGVATFNVKPAGDTTTLPPSTTTTDPAAPLVVLDLPASDAGSIVLPAHTPEVAVEPATVLTYLSRAESIGGVVVARMNGGDWVALSATAVTWIPVGTGKPGLVVRIVGAKSLDTRTFDISAATTSTTETTTTEPIVSGNTLVAATTERSRRDTTLWVILVLVGMACFFVVVSRLTQRRH